MTWSYGCDPQASQKDEVRFLLGDTDATDQKIKDEEIVYLLKIYGSALVAAVNGARAIAAKFTSLFDERVGDISVSKGEVADRYRKLADQLQGQVSEIEVCPFVGGISVSDVCTRRQETDRIQEEFEIGQDDDYRSFSDHKTNYRWQR